LSENDTTLDTTRAIPFRPLEFSDTCKPVFSNSALQLSKESALFLAYAVSKWLTLYSFN